MDGSQSAEKGEPVEHPELASIVQLCDGEVRYMVEAGQTYIFMQRLHFIAKGVQKCMDALLCLNWNNPTYPTRLFLPEQLGLGLNWHQQAYIMARNWFTWSWKDVKAGAPPIEILADHLAAFR